MLLNVIFLESLDFGQDLGVLRVDGVGRSLLNVVSVNGFLRLDEVGVFVLEALVLEFPDFTSILFEMDFVLLHVGLELFGPAMFEIDLLGNLIRDVSEIDEDHDHIRLLMSSTHALISHLSLLFILIFICVSVFNELFSLWNKGTDVVEGIFVQEV